MKKNRWAKPPGRRMCAEQMSDWLPLGQSQVLAHLNSPPMDLALERFHIFPPSCFFAFGLIIFFCSLARALIS